MSTALVVGRAKSVWDEIAAAKALSRIDYTLVTGPIAVDFPDDIDCWVWFHTECFKDLAERRARKGFTPAKSYWAGKYRGQIYSRSKDPVVQYVNWSGGGSSGLVAVMVALDELKVDKVILAGIPMTADGGQYDTSKVWTEAVKHRHSWELALPKLKDRVRSFSGWTQTLLGTPTADWVRGGELAVA